MTKLTIDGKEIEVPAGLTVIQACEIAGVEIPRFCYHERLAIAGNCRMCLVEVSPGPPKPQASCALPCADGMVVKTNSPMVKKAREGVMEFLLINHPLDCPICDQGGECDLQDQAMTYGTGTSRYHEHKRSVEDKYMGPLVKTHMTRCIHCTRCIRFITDVAGVPDLGATGRGEHMEVTTYVEKAIASELSGNIIDLCPVGALTSKPYAFVARPWELKKTETIDVMDALGSNVRVDSRGDMVLRVLPRLHEEVNEEWISDKSRYACDGLRTQRLDRPYVRKDGKLKEASWDEALQVVAQKMQNTSASEIAALAGDMACVESMAALKDLMQSLGVSNLDCRQDGTTLDTTSRSNYLFNSTVAGIEESDFILLIGTNPRLEAPVLNARIRKTYLRGKLSVAAIGTKTDLTYKTEWLGDNPSVLLEILSGKHPITQKLKAAQKPMLILGMGALTRKDAKAIFETAKAVASSTGIVKDGWNGFNVLHTAAARVGGLDIGFVPQSGGKDTKAILDGAKSGEIKLLYLLGADELPVSDFGNAFVVYQGHHGDVAAARADVILPGSAYTEKNALYVNTEGRVQSTLQAIFPPGQAKEDWKILRALSERVGKTLPYDTHAALRARIEKQASHFAKLDEVVLATFVPVTNPDTTISSQPITYPISNFYMTDPISRASKTMAECVSAMQKASHQEAA